MKCNWWQICADSNSNHNCNWQLDTTYWVTIVGFWSQSHLAGRYNMLLQSWPENLFLCFDCTLLNLNLITKHTVHSIGLLTHAGIVYLKLLLVLSIEFIFRLIWCQTSSKHVWCSYSLNINSPSFGISISFVGMIEAHATDEAGRESSSGLFWPVLAEWKHYAWVPIWQEVYRFHHQSK